MKNLMVVLLAVMVKVFIWFTLTTLGFSDVVAAVIAVIYVGGFATFITVEILRYPLCPDCGHNAYTYRTRLLESEVVCEHHGSFTNSVPPFLSGSQKWLPVRPMRTR